MKFIAERVRRVLKSDFNRSFATLFSGSALAQIIPLVASVVLARLYSPEEFGVLAIFMSVVMIFTSVVNLRYEFAIPLAIDDKESVTVSLLAGFFAICFSVILFVIFVFFGDDVLRLMGGEKLGRWLLLVPITILMSGIYNCLNYFSVRFKKYKVIAGSNIIRSSSSAVLQLGFGLIGFGQSGLILGYICSFFFGNIKMFRNFYSYRRLIQRVTKYDLKQAAVRFKQFPLVSIWGVFINDLSININNFVIPRLFGMNALGFYSYSFKNLNMPLGLISRNIGQVYYQQCIEVKKSNGDLARLFGSVFKKLAILVIPIFVLLYFSIESLFEFVYGADWRIAGTFCKILLPLFLVRSMFSPLSLLTMALEKQRLMTLYQFIILLSNVFVIILAVILEMSINNFLSLYSYGMASVYILLLVSLYRLAHRN